MQSSNIKRLKQQEAENRKLKQMYAQLSLTYQLQQKNKKIIVWHQFVRVGQKHYSHNTVLQLK